MIGKLLVCRFVLQFLYINPPGATYETYHEVQCTVIDERPIENDGRRQIKVNCTEDMNMLRLSNHVFNTRIRWAMYEEDCL